MMERVMLVCVVACSLLMGVGGMSRGPPVPDTCNSLAPQHANTSSQEGRPPFTITTGAYVPGAPLPVRLSRNITSAPMFKGFMMQARESVSGPPIGSFIASTSKTRTLRCQGTSDSVSHANSNPVPSIAVQWRAEDVPPAVNQIIFYYSVVQEFDVYWVLASSEPIPIAHDTNTSGTPEGPTGTMESPEGHVIPLKEAGVADILVRLHGSLMVFAWGVLAPTGIMLVLFYKIVWPNGQWFYAHIGLMIGTLVFSILGVVSIVVHADGKWLSTTATNLPHQIMGIVALSAVGINPFIPICRCHQDSSWRWVFNTIHGSIGLMLGQAAAFGAMLLGTHIVRELSGVNMDYVHYAIYSMSATVGLTVMIAAFFNIYSINYTKNHPTAEDLGVTSEPPSEFAERMLQEEDDDDEPKDCCCRCCTGFCIILLLLAAAVANITLLALL